MLRLSALRRAAITNGRTDPKSTRFYHTQPRPEPLGLPAGCHSLVSLINTCSNLVVSTRGTSHTVGTKISDGSLTNEETVVPFRLFAPDHSIFDSQGQRNIGLLRPQVVDAIIKDHVQAGSESPWTVTYPNASSSSTGASPTAISFSNWVNGAGHNARTSQVEKVVRQWKQNKMFEDILRGTNRFCSGPTHLTHQVSMFLGWSNEAYPVYNPSPRSKPTSIDPVAFSIERAALPLFGFPNFGSLLIGHSPQDPTLTLMNLISPLPCSVF